VRNSSRTSCWRASQNRYVWISAEPLESSWYRFGRHGTMSRNMSSMSGKYSSVSISKKISVVVQERYPKTLYVLSSTWSQEAGFHGPTILTCGTHHEERWGRPGLWSSALELGGIVCVCCGVVSLWMERSLYIRMVRGGQRFIENRKLRWKANRIGSEQIQITNCSYLSSTSVKCFSFCVTVHINLVMCFKKEDNVCSWHRC
jgi:hypothetical protein